MRLKNRGSDLLVGSGGQNSAVRGVMIIVGLGLVSAEKLRRVAGGHRMRDNG